MQQFRAGTVKVFGILANKRWFGAPEVPTLAEGGLPGDQIEFWHGLWAPKGTPKDVVAKLNAAVAAAFADPAVRKRFADLGHEIPARELQSPQALFAHHKAELDRWWPIIKAAGIKIEVARVSRQLGTRTAQCTQFGSRNALICGRNGARTGRAVQHCIQIGVQNVRRLPAGRVRDPRSGRTARIITSSPSP